MKCRHCGRQVQPGTSHYCPEQKKTFEPDNDSFLISYVVADATESSALGILAGGSVSGSILGDANDGEVVDGDEDDD